MSLRDRFFAKVEIGPIHPGLGTPCHLWTGSRGPPPVDYGRIFVGGRSAWGVKVARAHRVAWFLATGEIPPEQVLHHCDTPRCVNVEHLFLGSHADNMADKQAKGRAVHREETKAKLGKNPARGDRSGARLHPESVPRGERNAAHRLTEAQVAEIRALAGLTNKAIAERYGVSARAVGLIRLGQTWAHAPGPRPGAIPPATGPRKRWLSAAEAQSAILALLPASDRGGTRRHPEKPYRWGALNRLAERLGVSVGLVTRAYRDGATEDMIQGWRETLAAGW